MKQITRNIIKLIVILILITGCAALPPEESAFRKTYSRTDEYSKITEIYSPKLYVKKHPGSGNAIIFTRIKNNHIIQCGVSARLSSLDWDSFDTAFDNTGNEFSVTVIDRDISYSCSVITTKVEILLPYEYFNLRRDHGFSIKIKCKRGSAEIFAYQPVVKGYMKKLDTIIKFPK